MHSGNLFSDDALPAQGEHFTNLLHHRNLVIERIVSSCSISPHEYIQPQDEWVLLVWGEAVLRMNGEMLALKQGDYLFIPAGVPHSVEHASDGAMWLAVHLHPQPTEPPAGIPSRP